MTAPWETPEGLRHALANARAELRAREAFARIDQCSQAELERARERVAELEQRVASPVVVYLVLAEGVPL